ncbi:DNA-binding CsgD family transcriptional regulator [Novosphingobium sp. PhB165]|nr:DNA-binding CsgD family transcriptional regulator [Novosphingobium sp. PhB165]
MPVQHASWGLTEKEKQTLRLIVRGHDAKSIARSLDLSVHTINERLRDARRKMAVSSSREAARLLLEVEGEDACSPNPELFVDAGIGGDAAALRADQAEAPTGGAGWFHRHPRISIGVLFMTFALGLLALASLTQVATPPSPTPTNAVNQEVVDAARQWLTLVDQGRWEDSYKGTGSAFQKLNTLQVWAETSERVRIPLGAAISRTLLSQEDLPAPPYGYEVVKFRTSYAKKADAVETVSLARENGVWRVAGVTIE